VIDAAASRDLPKGAGSFYGWKLLAVFWLVLLSNLGFTMYGGALLYSTMATRLGFTHQMLGLPFSVFLGVVGLSSPLVALIIQRIGVRWTLIAGNLCVVAGALLMGTVIHTGPGAVAVFGGLIGFGVASGGNLTAQTAIPRWFVRRRALAFAIMLSAGATGGFFAPPLLNAVMTHAGGAWAPGWLWIAGCSAFVATLSALFVRESPVDIGQSPDGVAATADMVQQASSADDESWSLSQAARQVRFWVIGFASAVATGAFGLMLAHGIANATEAGQSLQYAALSLSLISVSGFAGKAIAGGFGDRFSPALIWSTMMGLMSAGLTVASVAVQGTGIFYYAVLAGAGFGGVVVCQPLTCAWLYGPKHFAKIASSVYFLQAIAGIVVPWWAGRAFDRWHTYRYSFAAAAFAALLTGLLLVACARARVAKP
jgi:MFS family permease